MSDDSRLWARRLRGGLIPAVPVPFDRHGTIHRDAQRAYASYMAEQPIAGVAVWAHTGRGLLLDASQRREVLSSWRAALPRERAVVAGVGCNPKRETESAAYIDAAVRMGAEALELGADAFPLPRCCLCRYDYLRSWL